MDNGEDVIFSFDDYSIEGTRGIKLEMVRPEKYKGNPIVERGNEGEHDEAGCAFCSVVYDKGIWRMWYSSRKGNWHKALIGYAESSDGAKWEKPKLGLVEYMGSKENNIIKAIRGLSTVSVLFDKDAPPEYRYIMVGEDMSWYNGWTLDSQSTTRIDVSSDGYVWKPLKNEPGIIPQMNETITIYKHRGQYHIGGHQVYPLLRHPMQEHGSDNILTMLGPRTFVVWRSPRLDKWPLENTKAFFKPMRSSSPYLLGWDREEVHVGATVTTYNNICLGIYGQWHHPIIKDGDGNPIYDGKAASVDLGFIISNDGLHFREPAPGFTFIKRNQELTWDRDYKDNKDKDNILLLQGPMINTDKLTHIYYTAITPTGNEKGGKENIGLALLPRDRFGYLSLIDENSTGQFVTCPLEYKKKMKLYINADISTDSSVQFYLMDENGLDVLTGYEKQKCNKIRGSGLDMIVTWEDIPYLPIERCFKIRCEIKGKAKVFALYLREI